MSVQLQDLELLDAVRSFTLQHPHPSITGFKPAMRDWGDTWKAVEPKRLPVVDILDSCRDDCDHAAHDLLECFGRYKHRLRWEQSYRKQDALVPPAMLDAYGFTEVIGLRGPFVSDRLRAGIGIWGAHIDYPQHRHDAEEVYVLLCGCADFRFDDGAAESYRAGDVVPVEPNRRHGFRTASASLVVFYLWQSGDLRQTSRFD